MLSKDLSQILFTIRSSNPYINANTPVNIRIIITFESPADTAPTIPPIVAAIIPIPINTLIDELMLCFTTSVSFCASILGYFKLMIIPIVSDISGNNTDAISIKRIDNISSLKRINNIKSPIKIHGSIIIIAVNILAFTIVVGF